MASDTLMHPHPRFFQCLQCGKCCKNFVRETEFGKAGIFLFPEERALFPPEKVFPLFGIGIGNAEGTKPQKIFAYQYVDQQCIHLDERNLCKIYEKKPTACEGYPYELTLLGIFVNEECTFLSKYPRKIIKRIHIPQRILQANIKMNKWILTNLRASVHHWFYDFESATWIKTSKIVRS